MSTVLLQIKTSGNEAYSVVPDPDDPVIMQVDGNLVRVKNLSALGVTILTEALKPGRRYPFHLDLPTAHTPMDGYLDALKEHEELPIECRFVHLQAPDIDRLHHYVLVRQKQVIRALRGGQVR